MSSPRFCSECGKPLEADHRFCTNCGTTTNAEADARTALTSNQMILANDHTQSSQSQVSAFQDKSGSIASTILTSNANAPGTVNMPVFTPVMPHVPLSNPQMQGVPGTSYSTAPTSADQFYAQTTDVDIIPPPPPPDSFVSTQQESPAAPYYTPTSQANVSVPVYAQAPKRSKGCLITSLVLLLVLGLGGVGGFYIISHINSTGGSQNGRNSSGQQNTSSSIGNTQTSVMTPGSNGHTPGAGGPTTISLNLKFIYSSVDITLVSVRQANSFTDDISSSQGGIRVVTMESNPTTYDVRYSYSDITRLIMPDGSIIAPRNAKYYEGPAAGFLRIIG